MRKCGIKANVLAMLLIITVATIITNCCLSFYNFSNHTNNCFIADSKTPLSDKIGSYTTYYRDSPDTRAHNIALAAQKINLTLVTPGQSISFNSLVGERSAARGFKMANIIIDGEFKEGMGGGICQVSSTLYNAWVTSGLDVISSKAHSLPVNYVPMSRDATVSSNIDLVLKNSSIAPILITTKCENAAIVVSIYGKSSGYEYNVTTRLIRELAPPPSEIIYDGAYPQDYEEILKKPRAGYITLATLQTLSNGKVISEKKLREDTYQPVRGKILHGGNSPLPSNDT